MTDKEQRSCETCDECVYLGEGDFACMERDYELVIADWIPQRLPCNKWTEGWCGMSEYIVEESPTTDETDISGAKHSVTSYRRREEIVRCRDCRNYHPDEGTLMRCRFKIDGFVQWRNAEADGFCAWADRREQ